MWKEMEGVFKVTLTWLFFADVSRNTAFILSANFRPSSVLTSRSFSRSLLLPTRTMGTLKKEQVS
jgi:hypothetical protein